MKVKEILQQKGNEVATVASNDTITEAVARLGRAGVGALVVSDDGVAIDGILTTIQQAPLAAGVIETVGPSLEAVDAVEFDGDRGLLVLAHIGIFAGVHRDDRARQCPHLHLPKKKGVEPRLR